MANITVEKHPTTQEVAKRSYSDPFTAMRDLMHWDPFRDGLHWLTREAGFSPAFEIKETKDAFEFRADVPGIDQKDIQVQMTDNRLVVRGKREAEKTDKGDTYYTYERTYGSFDRSFTVPEGVNADAIRADLKDGVLKVVLPKKPESKPREVPVKSG
ncbi:MAG TPA: HSP20 family small heat-shock protein [Polyangiaceae bacterium]|nr:HSP20 family small heat-shock protein [Polyangiaceae bacterium]